MPSPQLGPEYNVPVDVSDLDPEVILWLHGSSGDPIYALGSRLYAYGETLASMDELEALASVLDALLVGAASEDDEDDVARMMDLEYAVNQLIRDHEHTASVRVAGRARTAGMDDLTNFLSNKAWEEIEQFVDNLEYEYEYEKERLHLDVEDALGRNPELVETLRRYGVTPKLLLANLDEFYRYLQDNWADHYGYADVNYEPINKFVAEFESEWFNTVDDIVSNKMQISPERGQEILDTLMADGHVLSAFLCAEGWSCDWVDDILAVFGDDTITQDDLGFSGYSDAGSNAASEASWPAIQQVLAIMLEEYVADYLEEDAGKFSDPRQTNLPVR